MSEGECTVLKEVEVYLQHLFPRMLIKTIHLINICSPNLPIQCQQLIGDLICVIPMKHGCNAIIMALHPGIIY